ncbi:hypothetical protein, partial [Staphylococcus felis]|uniref:hypothetical protein n=1 Tax=Staphylococcus felis TaxID=46127 RepID=UPI001EE82EF6
FRHNFAILQNLRNNFLNCSSYAQTLSASSTTLINGVPKAGFSAERHSSAKLKNNFVRYEVLLKS